MMETTLGWVNDAFFKFVIGVFKLKTIFFLTGNSQLFHSCKHYDVLRVRVHVWIGLSRLQDKIGRKFPSVTVSVDQQNNNSSGSSPSTITMVRKKPDGTNHCNGSDSTDY
ncbi:hypothetical protein LOAG_06388 [Loa loa]|uniref:Uncharacterized protein n=1 Tax=Loa loa TaxID=7209 RepID=A0A1S0TYJ0_LOALO|nr:hypothetical protein LOAG_06388 [Loa loa]EFO22102.1 hypothetical protein LOAG_06388 [Loa loa]